MALGVSFARTVVLASWIVVFAGAAGLDPVMNMCKRWFHQSTIKDRILYIYGGLETFAPIVNGSHTYSFNDNYLIAVSLTTSWDWKTNISEIPYNISGNPNPATGTTAPIVSNGVLFEGPSSDSHFYLYGGTTSYWNTSFPGWQPPQSAQYLLWSYNPETTTWAQYDVSAASPHRPSNGLTTEAPDQGLAFFLNGEIDSGSDVTTQGLGDDVKVFLEGMVVIDTTAGTATNISTANVTGTQPRTRGGLAYIPNYGEHGILVTIGGTNKSSSQYDDEELVNFVPMDQVDVYDIDAYYRNDASYSGWFKQQVTGNVPPQRAQFCITTISAPDNSSHNIYLYGGIGAGNTPYDDVYVLSIPSFTWTKVFPPTGQGESPRWGHTCHTIGRLMLTVGGFITSTQCDWEAKGVAVLDMSSLQWGSVYDAGAKDYTVPDVVLQTIRSDGNMMTQPNGGFRDQQLAQLFGMNATTSDSSDRHIDGGAIAGGVVGGVAGLVLIIVVGFWVWRRRRPQSVGQQPLVEKDGEERHEIATSGDKHELEDRDQAAEMPASIPIREMEA